MQAILGHATLRTSMEAYAKATERGKRSAVASLPFAKVSTPEHFTRGDFRYLADANVEESEYTWNAERRGLTVRYFDTLDECGRVIQVRRLQEVVLDHELPGRIAWQRMKSPIPQQ